MSKQRARVVRQPIEASVGDADALAQHGQPAQALDLTLPGETRVAIAGDWHGNTDSAVRELESLHEAAPDVQTVLQLGDFGLRGGAGGVRHLSTLSETCLRLDIRLLVTPGHDEDWSILRAAFREQPERAVTLTPRISFLPRGFRFRIHNTAFLAFGGGAPLNLDALIDAGLWSPDQVGTDREVDTAIAAGPVQVLLLHEPINGGVRRVEQILRLAIKRRHRGRAALACSAASRCRVTRLWQGTGAEIVCHGHMHERGSRRLDDGRRVYSLGREGRRGNTAILDLRDLSWQWKEEAAAFALRDAS